MTNKPTPYQILGIADDKSAYFIDHEGWLRNWHPQTFDKKKLMVLAPINWWQGEHSKGKDKPDWDKCVDELLMMSLREEFDPDRVKGKGAWRNHNDEICYFDGAIKNVQGTPDKSWVFTRRVQDPIGLKSKHTSMETRNEIYEINKTLLYSTKYEAGKMLAWATMAPFCGALPWRASCFLTASSGRGKSSLVKAIVIPLAKPLVVSGGSSTEAGIRQRIVSDAVPIVVEELEDDTKQKMQNKEDILSLMRQSTTDDSPMVLKGTSDGGGMSFALKCMFFFVGISPEVSSEADDNRIVRINLKAPKDDGLNEWFKKEAKLKKLLSRENCDGIRAFTFKNLGLIFAVEKRIQPMIQKATGESARFAVVEAQLVACLLVVWIDIPNLGDDSVLNEWVGRFYKDYKKEEKIDDNQSIINKILGHEIKIYEDDLKGTYSVREMLRLLKGGKAPKENDVGYVENETAAPMQKKVLKRLLNQKGIGICPAEGAKKGQVAFAKGSTEIQKILGSGGGYFTMLERHKDCLGKHLINLDGTKNCVVVGGLLDEQIRR